MQTATKGIVIRSKSMGDDRLVTLLTPDFGVVNAIARNANKPRSKLTSSTEQFCYSSLILFRYRDNTTVDSAEVENSFFGLRADLEGLALASYLSELCCEIAPKEEEATEYLRLLLNSLHLIQKRGRPLSQIKAIFELRLLTLSGFMPDLTGCNACGEFKESGMAFSVETGELYCKGCIPSGQYLKELSPGVLAAMRHIIYSDFEKLFSFSLAPNGLKELSKICETYLKYHVQHTYTSLNFYHSVATEG